MITTTEVLPRSLAGERVDRVVAMLTECSRAEAAGLVASGAVSVDGRVITTRSVRLAEGQTVVIHRPVPHPEPTVVPDPDVVVPVVYADDHIVVVDKPAGLVVHPGAGNRTGTLVHGLAARFPELLAVGEPDRPGLVHRIDKGTSGLLVVARTPQALARLTAQMAAHSAEREYRALVWGHPEAPQGIIDAPIGRSERDPTRMVVSNAGRSARTRYEVVELFHDPVTVAEVRFWLETGRTHQIRVHSAAIGHPIVGDGRYGGDRDSLLVARPWLHAARLGFLHPATGEPVEFEAPVPSELAEVRARLS